MYLFVAYKPMSEATCRSLVVETYQADFVLKDIESEEELVKVWSGYIDLNHLRDSAEIEYGFWVYKDGLPLWREGYSVTEEGEDLFRKAFNFIP